MGTPPRVNGVRGLPRENFEFLALLCAFLMRFLCVWDQISVTIFARKDRKPNVIKPNAKQNRFLDSHDFFFTFFFSIFLRHYVT